MWVVSLKLFTYLHMLSFEILTLARLVSHMLTDPSPTRKIYLVLMNNSCSFPIPFFTLLWRWCHWYSYNVWVFIYWQLYFFKANFLLLRLLYINEVFLSLWLIENDIILLLWKREDFKEFVLGQPVNVYSNWARKQNLGLMMVAEDWNFHNEYYIFLHFIKHPSITLILVSRSRLFYIKVIYSCILAFIGICQNGLYF